jgi:PAS domain S-box-containing protein
MQKNETPSIIVVRLTQNGTVDFVNAGFEQLSGLSLAEIKGEDWFTIFLHSEDVQRSRALFQTAVRGDQVAESTSTIIASDGRQHRIHWSQIVRSHPSDATSLLFLGQVKLESRSDETPIEVDRRRLIDAQRIAKIGSWELDLRTDELHWSSQVFTLFELDPGAAIANYVDFLNAIHPDDRDAVNEAYSTSLKTQQPYEIKHRLKMNDGRIKWVHESCETEFDTSGNPRISRGTVQDITEIVEAERAKSRAEETLSSVLNCSQEAIIVIDDDMLVENFNEGAERIFGYSRASIIGQPFDILIPDFARAGHQRHVDQFKASPVNSLLMNKRGRIAGQRKNGEHFPAEASVSKVKIDNAYHFSVIIHDISARVAREHALQVAVQRAETASDAKSAFLATMSHEIRTPLHGILGMAQLLKRTDTDKAQDKYVSSIEESGGLLLSLINDILDLSRVEAGLLELDPKPVELQRIVEAILSGFQAAAQEKGLEFNIVVAADVPESFLVDQLRLRQVLTNLIGNAVKFTTHGSVAVEVSLGPSQTILFTVRDTGIGLSKNEQEQIFDRFVQGDDTIQRRYGGSGLGLSIVKELINLMSGEVGVVSQAGQGAAFWFSIPLSPVPMLAEATESVASDIPPSAMAHVGLGKTALVVDDIQANRLVCSALLQELGFKTIECCSGTEALKTLNTDRIDIVFLDLHMPEMSGDECIQIIRSSDTYYCQIPIVVLTADASESANRLAKSVGAQAICTKPFTQDELASVSKALLGHHDDRLEDRELPLHIVLIDDDESEFELLNAQILDVGNDVRLEHYVSTSAFCEQGDANANTTILLDGRMPPITSHEESLELLSAKGCAARIHLLSADKFIKIPAVNGLNIAGSIDKFDLQNDAGFRSFIQSLRPQHVSS